MTDNEKRLDSQRSKPDTRSQHPASGIENPGSKIQFVAIGHFTHDVTQDGFILGGAVAYSTIAARGIGLQAGVVSAVGKDFLYYEKLNGISLALVDTKSAPSPGSDLTTSFTNIYEDGVRRQILNSVSAPIKPQHIPPEWVDAEIVYLCPVADEVDPAIVHMFPNSLIGISPQGWMREWDDRGHVSPRKWKDAEDVLPYADVLVMSEEDISPFPEVVDEYAKLTDTMVLTRGENGSTLFRDGQVVDFPAFRARVVDPTGAGDVFAVAFLSSLRQTRDAHKASVFANCTASFVVEGQGTEGIPDLSRIRSRMMSHTAGL